ncbi:MAG: DNA polymerase III subunit epsilon [Hyphomicrobiales bacterium]|nr:DNA polymerase III subunit epsilon [Hyphomicrobiales bacterium]
MREIALDTETTGLDPQQGHRIVEIGCVEMINHVRTGKVFHVYINPRRDIPEAAYAVHGLSSEFLSDKPTFDQIADEFMTFIDDARLVIHNAQFDMKFINWECQNIGKPVIPEDQILCTLMRARKEFPGSPASLDALCKRFNIDTSARTLHGALLDAELLADMYLELVGGLQVSMALSSNAGNQKAQQKMERKQRNVRYFPLKEEEQTAHAAFIEMLKDPLWKKISGGKNGD